MEQSRAGYGRKRMSMGNVIGDPFALATISIAAVSFPLTLVVHVFALQY